MVPCYSSGINLSDSGNAELWDAKQEKKEKEKQNKKEKNMKLGMRLHTVNYT